MRRSASERRILTPIAGCSSSSARNDCSVITSARIGVVAVTVAVRGLRETSEISPRKSPGPRVRTFLPLRRTSALPSMITKNSWPGEPSLVRFLPLRRSISSVIEAIFFRSDFDAAQNSGTWAIASTFVSWRARIRAILKPRTRGVYRDALRDPVEPERRERGAEQQEGRPGGREGDRQLALLLVVADARRDFLVDAAQLLLGRRLVGLAARGLRDRLQGRLVGRHRDDVRLAEFVRHLDAALVGAECDREHRHAGLLRALRGADRVAARRARAVGEDDDRERRAVLLRRLRV